MQKFDELISYFNRKVSEMNIGTSYKMELLGMVTALGYAHEKEIEERKTGRWRRRLVDSGFNADWHCSECGWKTSLEEHGYNFCPNCGAKMER